MLVKSFLLVVFVGCTFQVSKSEEMTVAELNAKCGEIIQIDSDEIHDFYEKKPQETDNRKVKCFVRCMLTGLNMMTPEGELTPDEGTGKEVEQKKKYFPACKDVPGEDSCEKAFNFQKCIWNQVKKDKNSS